jgi:Fe-S-cluster containining protein
MNLDPLCPSQPTLDAGLDAGAFSAWLARSRNALLESSGSDVDCGDCRGCCRSSYFIHIRPEETSTLERIDPRLLFAAPAMPRGNVLMGYDEHGRCPMLVGGDCSIYPQRPQTCRRYDCRIFAATGLAAGDEDEKSEINERVRRWRFSYPTEQDRLEHDAILAAADFIARHPECFPNGMVPTAPSHLALLAIKVYGVFLVPRGRSDDPESRKWEIARAVVEESRKFDAMMEEREVA